MWLHCFVGDNQEAFHAALAKEQESLKRVLREVLPTDHDYSVAVKTACGARYIATIKRNGTCKIRGVEQGCFEDPTLDGTDFNYYAHVSKFVTKRMALFRKDRHIRTIATIDISTAFLQSYRYKPHEPRRYVKFKDPVLKEWRYYWPGVWEQIPITNY